MTDIFMSVLNMSVTAAFVIAALCAARLVLKRLNAPKWISYALWAVAGFRLAVPFTFESFLSLIPHNLPSVVAPVRQYYEALPPTGTSERIDYMLAASHPAGVPIWTVYDVLSAVWLVGVAAMLLYAVISYVRLISRKDSVTTPFIYGFIKPKIHIPGGLAGDELRYVTLHEQTHIRRHDHLIKLLAFVLLCVHWFNPLAWIAFVLLCADMEMSCDERVLRELGTEVKADYSQTLLSLSMKRRILNASPLAFGEGGIKERVKNVLNFKKRSRVIIVAAIALAAVLSAGFALNRADSGKSGYADTIFDGVDGSFTVSLPNHLNDGDMSTDIVNAETFWTDDILPELQSGNRNAVFQGKMLGNMNTWDGGKYTVVSQDENSGAVTTLVYYREDYITNRDYSEDMSNFGTLEDLEDYTKAELLDLFGNDDGRRAYFKKGVMAYNIAAKHYVTLEFNWNAVTDEELEEIARSVKIDYSNLEQNPSETLAPTYDKTSVLNVYRSNEYDFSIAFPFEYGDAIEVAPQQKEVGFRDSFAITVPSYNIGRIAWIDVYDINDIFREYGDQPFRNLGANDNYEFILRRASDLPLPGTDEPGFAEAETAFLAIRDALDAGLYEFSVNVQLAIDATVTNDLPPEVLETVITYLYALARNDRETAAEYAHFKTYNAKEVFINAEMFQEDIKYTLEYEIVSVENINESLYALGLQYSYIYEYDGTVEVLKEPFGYNFVGLIDGKWLYMRNTVEVPDDISENFIPEKFESKNPNIIGTIYDEDRFNADINEIMERITGKIELAGYDKYVISFNVDGQYEQNEAEQYRKLNYLLANEELAIFTLTDDSGNLFGGIGLVNVNGKIVVKPDKYAWISHIEHGFLASVNYSYNDGVSDLTGRHHGLLDEHGNVVVEPTWDYIGDWDVKSNTAHVRRIGETNNGNGVVGTLNIATGKIEPFPFDKAAAVLGVSANQLGGYPTTAPDGAVTETVVNVSVLDGEVIVSEHLFNWDGTPYIGRTATLPLADLPTDYGAYENREQAIADGVYVNVQGVEIYNQTVVDIFYENALAGVPAFMRVINYTIEGDPIISDYQYDGEVFTVTTDSSRDKFGGSGNENFRALTYKYLIKLGNEWTLSKVEADKVAGLAMGWIPAPSDNAAIS
jgi:beta-lactamase regulating signal transducer with metallopeptidase domain